MNIDYVACVPTTLVVPQILYKYRSFSERSLDSLCKNEIYFSRPQDFDDPFEPVRVFEKSAVGAVFEKSLHRCGMFCLCSIPSSLSMWSYYGAALRGFAVGYDTSELLQSISSRDHEAPDWKYFFSVDYSASNTLPLVETNYLVSSKDIERHPQEIAMFATKASIFAHENEYRIMLRPEPDFEYDGYGLRNHSPAAISQIIFGELMSRHEEEVIRKSLSGRNIAYKRAKRSDKRFEIVMLDA